MAQDAKILELAPEADYTGDVGAYRVEVRATDAGGAIALRSPSGPGVRIVVRGDTLTLHWDGPEVRLEAPAADMTLAARNLHLQAEENFTVEARREVDIHGGTDVELRADHHVNLWGHGVLVGD